MLTTAVTFVIAALVALAPPAQDPATRRHQGMVMGFDQDATIHHFRLFTDGGAIEVTVKDADDRETLAAVRRHLGMLPAHFAAGDFSTPRAVHEGTEVTGADDLARLKDHVEYRYRELERGGRVDLVTTHAEALAAVHAFLRFQIADHETGDSTDVTRRR